MIEYQKSKKKSLMINIELPTQFSSLEELRHVFGQIENDLQAGYISGKGFTITQKEPENSGTLTTSGQATS